MVLGLIGPSSYADVAPYYDKVEMLIGVYGSNESLENTPNSPPGCLLPPPKPLVSDLLIAQRAKRLGIPVIPGHRAVLTQPLDYKRSPPRLHPGNATAQKILADDMRKRAACLWATPCGRGCAIRANYQSPTVHLPPALMSGNLDITTDAMVHEVTLGRDGRANGVNFVDRTSGKQRHAAARVVVLAASACEIGAYPAQLQDRAVSAGTGEFQRQGRALLDGYGRQRPRRADSAARESAAAQRRRRRRPSAVCALVALSGSARGQAGIRPRLSHRIRRRQAHAGVRHRRRHGMAHRRELWRQVQAGRSPLLRILRLFRRARRDDPERSVVLRDRSERQGPVGNPGAALPLGMVGARTSGRPHICRRLSPASSRRWADARMARCRPTAPRPSRPAARSFTRSAAPSWDPIPNHRSPTNGARLGTSTNLFITDGAVFASNADKNPTLTILALAWRAADHILERMRRKEL